MAKMQYCWRGNVEMPMLEEDEWREILPVCTENLNPDVVVMKSVKQCE